MLYFCEEVHTKHGPLWERWNGTRTNECTRYYTCYTHTDTQGKARQEMTTKAVCADKVGELWNLGHTTILGQRFTERAHQEKKKKVTQLVWLWNNASFMLQVQREKAKNSTQLENGKKPERKRESNRCAETSSITAGVNVSSVCSSWAGKCLELE